MHKTFGDKLMQLVKIHTAEAFLLGTFITHTSFQLNELKLKF